MGHPLVDVCVQNGLGELRQRVVGANLFPSDAWALWRAVPEMKLDFQFSVGMVPAFRSDTTENVWDAAVENLSTRAQALCFSSTDYLSEQRKIWADLDLLPRKKWHALLETSCQWMFTCHEFVRLLHQQLGRPKLHHSNAYVTSRWCCASPLRALKFSLKYGSSNDRDTTNAMVWKTIQANRPDVFRHLFLVRSEHFSAEKFQEYYNYTFCSSLSALTLEMWECMGPDAREKCRGQSWGPIRGLHNVRFVEHVCAVHGIEGLRKALSLNPRYVFNVLRTGPLVEESLRVLMPLVNQCTNPFGRGLGESVLYLEEAQTLKLLIRYSPEWYSQWYATLSSDHQGRICRMIEE